MADQWDAFPDAGTTATADDPFSKFPDVEKPKAAAPSGLALAIGKILGTAQDVGTEALSSFSPELSQRVFGQTTASLRPEQIAPPLVSPERAKEFVGELPSWAGGNLPIVQGATESLSSALSSLTAPGTLAQLPAFVVPGVAETFAANVLHDVPKQFEKLGTVVGEHGLFSKEAGAAIGEAGITDLMGLLAGKSGTAGRFRSTAGEIAAAPTTLSEKLAPVLNRNAELSAPLPPETSSALQTPEATTPNVPNIPSSQLSSEIPSIPGSANLETPLLSETPTSPMDSSKDVTISTSEIPAQSAETAAAPITPQGTRIEGPALIDSDGNVIIQGKLGETHADLLKQASEGPDAEKSLAAFENDAQHVFVDDQGNVLNREQAAPVGVKAGQLPEGTVKVESQMLKAEKPIVSAVDPITDLVDRYDSGDDHIQTIQDLVDAVEVTAGENSDVKALDAVEKFRDFQRDDQDLGGRGDWDEAEQEFLNDIKTSRTKLEPAATSNESTTGIAQRVNEARTEAGRTGEIQPGEGVSAEEMVNRGRELLKGGADPEAIIAGVSEGKAVTGDEMAVLRARREELSRVSDQAADDLRKNPNDPVLKQAADDAFKAETDFAQRIKPAATEWHKVGEAMQGETDIATGTFTGLRRAFMERTGRDVTKVEAAKLEKTAETVSKTEAAVDKAKADFSKVVEDSTKGKKLKTADELKSHFAERIAKLLPC